MLVKIRGCDFSKERDRTSIIKAIASLFSPDFEPYTLDSFEKHWHLDRGNDWWLTITNEEQGECHIHYRYQNANNDRESQLMGWMEYRFGAQQIAK